MIGNRWHAKGRRINRVTDINASRIAKLCHRRVRVKLVKNIVGKGGTARWQVRQMVNVISMIHLWVTLLLGRDNRGPIPNKNSLIAGTVNEFAELAVRCCCRLGSSGGSAGSWVRGNATRSSGDARNATAAAEAVLGCDCWCWCWASPSRLL